MPRFSGGGGGEGEASDEVKLMDGNADAQPSCSESVADDKEVDHVSEMSSNECSSSSCSLQSLAKLRSAALAINIKSSKKVVAEETPAPCSSPSSSFQCEAWTHDDDVQQISSNSILNKRKLADKLNILALAREKSSSMEDSSEDDDADAASFDALCFLQTNKRGKSTVSDTTGASNRAKLKNCRKPR